MVDIVVTNQSRRLIESKFMVTSAYIVAASPTSHVMTDSIKTRPNRY